MRTVLKRGQRVDIYRPSIVGVNAEMEGAATLIQLVRKSHTSIPPFETWTVRFDDDEEPVQRDIPVKLPQVTGMASSLARLPESRNLLAFMAAAGISNDWVDTSGITAYTSGKVLSNEVGAVELAGSRKINEEMLVHLEHGKTKIVLNLTTLLVLASSYIRQQFNIAAEAVENNNELPDSDSR
jgi:hypothetical protein